MLSAKILVIAPYSEMVPDLEAVAREFPEAAFSIQAGDLGRGLETALSVFHMDFDVVVSRGGTAQMLEDELSIPVIEITPTARDLMRILLSIPDEVECVAAVGFRNVLASMKSLEDLLPYELDLYAIDFEDELPQVMDAVAAEHYDLVLCDTKAHAIACDLGLNAKLFVADRDSIRDAFRRAIDLFNQYAALENRVHFLQETLRQSGARIAVYTLDQRLLYTTLADSDEVLLDELPGHVGRPEAERFMIRHGKRTYTIRSYSSSFDRRSNVTFIVSSHDSSSADRFAGITYLDRAGASAAIERTGYDAIGGAEELRPLIKASDRRHARLFLGESGGAQLPLALQTYIEGARAHDPLVEIACDIVDEKSWTWLMGSHRSPLFDAGLTILITRIQNLPFARWKELVALIADTHLDERCDVLLTATYRGDARDDLIDRTVDELACQVVSVPPLRSWSNLEEVCVRTLGLIARQQDEQPPDIDPRALELVLGARWPGNLTQLKRVMRRAYALCEGNRIQASDVLEALERDMAADTRDTGKGGAGLAIMRPLAETEHDVATMVLAACDNNKSSAAGVLGISRTTLYRLLKRGAEDQAEERQGLA